MRSLTIFYKCSCFEKERSLEVAERRDREEIEDYMSYVQRAIEADHRFKSPLCLATTLEYAKIPLDNDQGIGFTKGGTA